ncbi:MAG: hypothetical protein PHQ19_03505 [Candidatus Krumholzibacteria bacterium]|nr:hypothetical protein [Candidatus Krumholzibacteria bacterium]
MKRTVAFLSIAACLVVAGACAASAHDEKGRAYGIRLGYGADPDQFVAGVQTDLGSVYRNIHFAPSVDFGFGEHVTTIGFNGDLKAFLYLPKAEAALYALAGPSIEIWSPDEGDGDTEIGVYVGGGVRAGLGERGWYNLEARFGIGDVPEFRILIGVLFGGR